MSLFDLDFLGFEKRAEKEQEGGGAGSSGWMALPKKTRGYLSILANLFVKYIDEKEEKAFDSEKSDKKVLFSTKLKQLYDGGKKGQAKKLVSQLRKKHKVMSKKKVTIKDEDGNEKEVEKSVWNPDSQYFQWFKTNAAKHVEGKAKKSVKELVEQVKGQKKEDSKPKAEKPKKQEEKKETEGKKEEKSQGNLPKDWKTWPKARRQKWIQDQKNKEKGTPTSQKNTQSTSTRGAPKNLPNTGRGKRARTKEAANFSPPNWEPRLPNETDKQYAKRVIDKGVAPKRLPEDHKRYFNVEKANIKKLPLSKLHPSKIDNEQGGENGRKRMEAAYHGVLSRRDPITVFPHPEKEGHFIIDDGNGTYTSAKLLGWSSLPVEVIRGKLASTSNLLAYAQHSQNPVKFLVKIASKLSKKEAQKALRQASKIASTARILKTLKDEFSHVNKVDPRDPAYVRVKELLRKLDDQTLEMIINEDIKFVSRLAMTILTMRKN